MTAADSNDESMMREALRLARRGAGRTHPNPSVGAVVYRGKKILGRGTTRPPGGAHAEIVAIEKARRAYGARSLRGASIAVTLEPCNFAGRTGPCTEAILEAGLGRVVAGARDPHPRVSGTGFRRLQRGGVEVTRGVLDEECQRQHRGFISVCERRRPFVTLKLATSLDGRIALANGESVPKTMRSWLARKRRWPTIRCSRRVEANAWCGAPSGSWSTVDYESRQRHGSSNPPAIPGPG
jgi:diaminohydroxyphosphoribosylaminopyrimidine deaminase/5-amino-6-(5-phosphoribosylamino)uracil reductase